MANTDLVARLVDCWNTGKLEDIDNVLSPNFIRHETGIEGGTSGRDEYKQTVSRYRHALAGFHTQAADTIEQGNKLAYRFKTTGKRDNAPVMFEGVNILHIEGQSRRGLGLLGRDRIATEISQSAVGVRVTTMY